MRHYRPCAQVVPDVGFFGGGGAATAAAAVVSQAVCTLAKAVVGQAVALPHLLQEHAPGEPRAALPVAAKLCQQHIGILCHKACAVPAAHGLLGTRCECNCRCSIDVTFPCPAAASLLLLCLSSLADVLFCCAKAVSASAPCLSICSTGKLHVAALRAAVHPAKQQQQRRPL